MEFRDVAALARRQHGVVARDQLLDSMSRRQLEHLVATGRLERMHRGVYRVSGTPDTWNQAARAATLAGGAGALVSFWAGAHLWSLAGFWEQPAVEITIPAERRVRLVDITVHDSEVLDRPHVDRRRGIPVTSVARTLCDLTACCSSNQVGRALDDALRRRLTSMRRVNAVFDDLATRGRRRSTLMRGLLEERATAPHRGDSDAEVRMVQVLVAAGLPRPVQQHRVRLGGRTYRLDAAYPELEIALEYEGFDFHISRTAFDDRYERDRALRIAGWLVVYVTNRTTDARLVLDVRAALDLRSPPPSPTK